MVAGSQNTLKGACEGAKRLVGDLFDDSPPIPETAFQKHFLKIGRLVKAWFSKPHTGHQHLVYACILPSDSSSTGGYFRATVGRKIPGSSSSSHASEIFEKFLVHVLIICLGGKNSQELSMNKPAGIRGEG